MFPVNLSENVLDNPLDLNPQEFKRGDRVVYQTNQSIYQDITVVKRLNDSSLFLVVSNFNKLKYVMKIFPFHRGAPQIIFRNESRFGGLKHPNLIKSLYFEKEREAKLDEISMKISYAIREYADNSDFYNFLKIKSELVNEKVVRTYFRQLIEGLEYLHSNKIAHMDLKLQNLLIDQDYTLKISDFDLAHYGDDAIILSEGSKFFRAPEIISGKCNDTKPADIYSAGIILFVLYTKGVLPQFEEEVIDHIDFAHLLYHDVKKFWVYHSKLQKKNNIFFDDNLKELFISMTQLNPKDRPSIQTIKASKWYNGPYYSAEQIKDIMEKIFNSSSNHI